MSNINIGRFIDNINKSSKSIEQNLEFIQKMLWLVEAYLDEGFYFQSFIIYLFL